jgi:predicted dinucleotide-binding enzyme
MAGDLTGKVIVDCTNPLNDRFDGLTLGFDTSAAEQIAEWTPGAMVVKAFNTVSVATMEQPLYGEHKATLFFCGDNPSAKQRVHDLIEAMGMEPIDSGALSHARYLEPMAMLYIHLAIHQRMGGNCALKMLRRAKIGTA